jgi:hypothetical protein
VKLCGALARVGTGAHLVIILCSLGPRKLGAAVLLTAILGPLFLQCGQGGRKGPDGHGSELGNRNHGLLHPALGQVRFQAKHMPECRPVGRNSAIGFSDVAILFQES